MEPVASVWGMFGVSQELVAAKMILFGPSSTRIARVELPSRSPVIRVAYASSGTSVHFYQSDGPEKCDVLGPGTCVLRRLVAMRVLVHHCNVGGSQCCTS